MVNIVKVVTDEFQGVVRQPRIIFLYESLKFFQENAIVLNMFLYF
jgi:hypothetical protein